MYTQTRSKTISEATDKLYDAKSCDLVFGCTKEQLTDIQREALGEYLEDIKQYTEDVKLALENLYVNLTDDHIYVLESADDGNDGVEYYYYELVPLTTLYKDDLGNLWNYVGYDKESDFYQFTVVDEDDGHYTDTTITSYFSKEEFDSFTKIELEVR